MLTWGRSEPLPVNLTIIMKPLYRARFPCQPSFKTESLFPPIRQPEKRERYRPADIIPRQHPPTVPPLAPLQQTPVCDAPLPVSICSHCSTPAYEWEYAVFDFLFLCQFAEDDVLQIHPCPYKWQKLIISDCCIVIHGIYVPHFPCPVYHWWAFGLAPGLCYCKQCCNEHSCACVLIVEQFIILWIQILKLLHSKRNSH